MQSSMVDWRWGCSTDINFLVRVISSYVIVLVGVQIEEVVNFFVMRRETILFWEDIQMKSSIEGKLPHEEIVLLS